MFRRNDASKNADDAPHNAFAGPVATTLRVCEMPADSGNTSPLAQVDRGNLSEQVYRQLRNALLNGEFEPGQRLRISELALLLGTSITPVREAIFRLTSEQALELKTATAIHVPYIDARQLEEILTMRILLEGKAGERAASRITAAGIADLERIQRAFVEAAVDNPQLASVKNREFHFGLMQAAEMPLLQMTVENLWVKMGVMIRVFLTRVPSRQLKDNGHGHFDVIDGLKRRDGDAVCRAIQSDIAGARIMLDWLAAKD